ncbi:MAG: reverse transcriptase N-terminal domain-containing protein [Deltaproteobacteria bacterium]|nr:reverse transcriptase N-terminal domain-containing protein [Deltaproteobacteria bacterium]MBW2742535.1 reverse transcriptase N-terminal domain-containing protein [Deltaproteobacteria bacterium]
MTAVILPDGAPTGRHIKWKSINWKEVSMFVKRLQMRIAKAVKENMPIDNVWQSL